MPEVISKYPDVTLKVLRESGARCGEGEQQHILTNCPQERFCKLPTGEVCVLGVNELHLAQQVTPLSMVAQPVVLLPLMIGLLVAFALGLLTRRKASKGS